MACLYEKACVVFTLGKIKEVNSYKDMCKLLQEPDQSTHPDLKKRQLETWKLCFSWQMKKYKFTRIKVYSSEEYFYNLLKKKYYNTVLYTFCALLNQYRKTSGNYFLLATKSELALALGFYNEDFKAARFGEKTKLLEIENGTLDKYGTKYAYLKPYKEQIKNKKNDTDITPITSKAFEDFSVHQNKNINNKIDKLLEDLEDMRIIQVQKEHIGGFIDQNFIKHYNINVDKIYQKNGNFYYDVIDDKTNQKTSVLVPYEERILTDFEIATQLNIDGKAMIELNCLGFKEVLNRGKETTKKFYEKVSYGYLHSLNALFIYDSYKILFDEFFMSQSQEIFLQRNQDLFSLTSVKTSIENTNALSKDNTIENKKNRQSKEKVNKRYILGDNKNQFKQQELESIQKTELYLNRAFNEKFIDVSIDNFFPKDSTLNNLDEFQYSIWSKLFKRSDKKQENLIRFEGTKEYSKQISNLCNKTKDNTQQNDCHKLHISSLDETIPAECFSQTFIPDATILEMEADTINSILNSANSIPYLNFLLSIFEQSFGQVDESQKNIKEK